MPTDLVPPVCRGACCRNPWGVCTHKRNCTYHAPAERDELIRAQRARDTFIRAEHERRQRELEDVQRNRGEL